MRWNRFFESADVKVLIYLGNHKEPRYSDLLRSVGKTRGALAASLRDLRNRKLVERIIDDSKSPIESRYILTEKGSKTAELLSDLQKLIY